MQRDLETRAKPRGNTSQRTRSRPPYWPPGDSALAAQPPSLGFLVDKPREGETRKKTSSLPAHKLHDSVIQLAYPFDIQSRAVKFILEIYNLQSDRVLSLGHQSVTFPFQRRLFSLPLIPSKRRPSPDPMSLDPRQLSLPVARLPLASASHSPALP